MKESDLYPPVRDWLVKQGYEVHVEMFGHDIVAVKDGMVTVVELKLCASQVLMNQLRHAANWADFVIGAISTNTKQVDDFRCCGYGLLEVSGETVRKRVGARPQPWDRIKRRSYRVKKLTGREPAMPHELAGLPSCRQLRQQRETRLTTPAQSAEPGAAGQHQSAGISP